MTTPTPHFWKRAEGGQALLIATALVLLLFLGVTTMVFVHQVGVRHQAASRLHAQGQDIAEAGIAYAARLLSNNQITWNAALQSAFPVGIGGVVDCNSGHVVQGTQFKITCDSVLTAGWATRHPGLQSNQIGVIATAVLLQSNGKVTDGASVQTILSAKTMGAFLANGMRVGAALQMLQVPSTYSPIGNLPHNALTVHWGPIVCLDTTTWTLTNPLDQNTNTTPVTIGFPRKFSVGGITGAAPYTRAFTTTNALTYQNTDQKEYWAFASMGFPPLVSRSYYYGAAATAPAGAINETNMPAPGSVGGPTNITQIPAGSGHYAVTLGATAHFDANFTVPASVGPVANMPKIIYIDGPGNVVFDSLANMDLGTNGALIINVGGTVTFANPGAGFPVTLNIPMTAPQEYAYWPATAATQWPCKSQCTTVPGATTCTPGATCTPAQGAPQINFRGFLWVSGNLIVQGPGTWVLDGVVLIGDMTIDPGSPGRQLEINTGNGAALQIFYDANVNQSIQMNPG